MSKPVIKGRRFLSLVLRHAPENIGIKPDEKGWVDIGDLLAAARAQDIPMSRDHLDEVVFTNDKQRFAFSADGLRVRANQGHSIEVDLELAAIDPPPVLYHGTATRFLESIRAQGLSKMKRQHVHLSSSGEQARRVGARHGSPVVLEVDCAKMVTAGNSFFLSENGVWLTESVPAEFLTGLKPAGGAEAPT